MPLKLKSKSKSGFKGVRQQDSGRFGMELQCDDCRYWLGTIKTFELAAWAYNIAAWRFGPPREEMNFTEIATREGAEFIGLSVTIVPCEEEKKRDIRIVPSESDVEAMARFARENPFYVRYEAEFFWKQDYEKKKEEDEAGPLTVFNLESEEELNSSEEVTMALWNSIDTNYVSDE